MIANVLNNSITEYIPKKEYNLGDLVSSEGYIFRCNTNNSVIHYPPCLDCLNKSVNTSFKTIEENQQDFIVFTIESCEKLLNFESALAILLSNLKWTNKPTYEKQITSFSYPTLSTNLLGAYNKLKESPYIEVTDKNNIISITHTVFSKQDLQELNSILYSWIPSLGIKMNDSFLAPTIMKSGHMIPNNFYSIQNIEKINNEVSYHVMVSKNPYDINTVSISPDVTIKNNVLFGAAWNDYAEYRTTLNVLQPGRCVIENGDGTLKQSEDRLLPGGNIISDTFGFAIGKTENCKTPLAVAGRVLAYPYENRNEFLAGDAVCSGPNGTISRMTREEIREWPDRIIGYVSEIPNYKYWGEGNVEVNNRIWIKIK